MYSDGKEYCQNLRTKHCRGHTNRFNPNNDRHASRTNRMSKYGRLGNFLKINRTVYSLYFGPNLLYVFYHLNFAIVY